MHPKIRLSIPVDALPGDLIKIEGHRTKIISVQGRDLEIQTLPSSVPHVFAVEFHTWIVDPDDVVEKLLAFLDEGQCGRPVLS